jgi:hypothetical protein
LFWRGCQPEWKVGQKMGGNSAPEPSSSPVPMVPVVVTPAPVSVTPAPMPMMPTPMAVMPVVAVPTPVMPVMAPAYLLRLETANLVLRNDGRFHANAERGRRNGLLRRNGRQRCGLRTDRKRRGASDQGNSDIQEMSAHHDFLPFLAIVNHGRNLAAST